MLHMTNKDKSAATWSDVKATLGNFDRTSLLRLVHDLYTTSKDNRNFLHARFGLGCDVLKPYKTIMERWLWPDVYKHEKYSVAKAKKPISDYKKASGFTGGCGRVDSVLYEQAISFSREVGLDDGVYYDALVRMLEQGPEDRNGVARNAAQILAEPAARRPGIGPGHGLGCRVLSQRPLATSGFQMG